MWSLNINHYFCDVTKISVHAYIFTYSDYSSLTPPIRAEVIVFQIWFINEASLMAASLSRADLHM